MTGKKIKELIARQLGIDADKIGDDADLVADLGADSLDIIQMLISLEREFSLVFDDEQIKKVKTVKDVIDFVEAK
ncbi:MAG: acyl carrier protein [Christensenellales bacterium]|jgi:acyl carrier protein